MTTSAEPRDTPDRGAGSAQPSTSPLPVPVALDTVLRARSPSRPAA